MASKKIARTRVLLTLQELATLPDATVMYKAIGKA